MNPFYQSEKLFSLLYDGYEKNLNFELYSVHKNLNISMAELYDMPVYVRRNYIQVHNELIQKEKNKMESDVGK